MRRTSPGSQAERWKVRKMNEKDKRGGHELLDHDEKIGHTQR